MHKTDRNEEDAEGVTHRDRAGDLHRSKSSRHPYRPSQTLSVELTELGACLPSWIREVIANVVMPQYPLARRPLYGPN